MGRRGRRKRNRNRSRPWYRVSTTVGNPPSTNHNAKLNDDCRQKQIEADDAYANILKHEKVVNARRAKADPETRKSDAFKNEIKKFMDPARAKLCASESKWSAAARRRTAEDWMEILETLPAEQLKLKTACIVWYDFFGEKSTPLSVYKDEFKDLEDRTTPEELYDALVHVGYPNRIAWFRSGMNHKERAMARISDAVTNVEIYPVGLIVK